MSSRGKLFNLRAYRVLAVSAFAVLAVLALKAGSSAPDFGDPLPGLSPAQQGLFVAGKEEFQTVETAAEGLGPVFNGASCGECHSSPAVGGMKDLVETRFGRMMNGRFDRWRSSAARSSDGGTGGAGNCVNTPARRCLPRRRCRRAAHDSALRPRSRRCCAGYHVPARAASGLPRPRPGVPWSSTSPRSSDGRKFGWKAQVPSLAVPGGRLSERDGDHEPGFRTKPPAGAAAA